MFLFVFWHRESNTRPRTCFNTEQHVHPVRHLVLQIEELISHQKFIEVLF